MADATPKKGYNRPQTAWLSKTASFLNGTEAGRKTDSKAQVLGRLGDIHKTGTKLIGDDYMAHVYDYMSENPAPKPAKAVKPAKTAAPKAAKPAAKKPMAPKGKK
jgi:hypothetical protein